MPGASRVGGAEERAARKALTRIDRQLERIAAQEARLEEAMAAQGSDHEKLAELSRQLTVLAREKEALEGEWLEAAAALE